VKPEPFGGVRLAGSTLDVQLPPRSVAIIELR